VQYDSISRFFESTPEGLRFSGDNGIPLVRYNILDTGGLISYDGLLEFLAHRWTLPHRLMRKTRRDFTGG
jgi:phenylacetate-CoA ligase